MKKIMLIILIFLLGCGGGNTTSENTPLASNEPVAEETNEVNISEDTTTLSNYEYLNKLRNSAGMISLNKNLILQTAAKNHAYYLYVNNKSGHYETEGKEGFTGVTPVDRALNAGYYSKFVIENVSVGDDDYFSSIDHLFSAIYHRFGFLNFDINEIGIGNYQKDYVYDMGNYNLNKLCQKDNYQINYKYYVNVCKNEDLKIPYELYNDVIKNTENKNSRIVVWPYNGAHNVLPVFYEEDPDPLPDYSVSGYPISIQFNPYYFIDNVELNYFKLFDENGNEILNTRLINSQNDPNHEFTPKEFALFPLQRLEWGSVYNVEVSYTYNGNSYILDWSFKTKTLPYPILRIESQNSAFYINPSKTYALYFVPQSSDDIISWYRYSYPAGDDVEIGMIDHNTLRVKVDGNSGDRVRVELSNGDIVTLILE